MGSLPNMEENPPLISRISTVVPATPRGDEDGTYRLSYMDLLMKLHYIRTVSFFSREAAQGLSTHELKKPMFPLLDPYSHLSGRIRRSESGRPFIKCNDAGVRIAESQCEMNIEEWLDQKGYSIEGLVHDDHVLGPDLGFSPLVFVKFTWFKCGGLCVGLSWSHVIGDVFSASNFITMWSHTLAGHVPPKSLHMPNPREPEFLHNNSVIDPKDSNISLVKKVTILDGERWLATGDTNVITHSLYVAPKQLENLVTNAKIEEATNKPTKNNSYFEILSALVWKCIGEIRGNSGPNCVTICTNGTNRRENDEFPTNIGMVLSVVEANVNNVSIGESSISKLVRLISGEKNRVENHVMEKLVEESEGKEDFIVYGANLTFVDLEEANIYGAKLNGEKPIMANCAFHGVGDQGIVLVLPAPNDKEDGGSNGRMVTISLPEKELGQLKDKLGREWGIASHP